MGVWKRKAIDSRRPSMAAEKPLRRKQHAEELVPTLCARSTPVFFFRDANPLVTAKLDLLLNEVSAAVGQGHKSQPAGPFGGTA